MSTTPNKFLQDELVKGWKPRVREHFAGIIFAAPITLTRI